VTQKGFSLIELLIVVMVVGLIAAMAVPSYEKSVEAARIARAIGDVHALEKEILIFEALGGQLPVSLEQVGRADLLDPWQHPYVYLNFYVDPTPSGGNKQNQGNGGQGGNGGGHGNQVAPAVQGLMRRDRNLVPLNSRFDLYSKGKDGESHPPITSKASWDDIIRANDGSFVGLASNY
jgi:general secretion pathway protein G